MVIGSVEKFDKFIVITLVARLLLKAPEIQINTVTPKTSALHIAAKNGRLGLVQLLILAQADIK